MNCGCLIRSNDAAVLAVRFYPDAGLPAYWVGPLEFDAMPMRGELPLGAMGLRNRPSALNSVCSWIVAQTRDPEFMMIALFCTVGLWSTFQFMRFFTDFGAMETPLG